MAHEGVVVVVVVVPVVVVPPGAQADDMDCSWLPSVQGRAGGTQA